MEVPPSRQVYSQPPTHAQRQQQAVVTRAVRPPMASLGTSQWTPRPTLLKKQSPLDARRELLSGLTRSTRRRLKRDEVKSDPNQGPKQYWDTQLKTQAGALPENDLQALFPDRSLGGSMPQFTPLHGAAYAPLPFQHSTSFESSNSDNESVFSACSSASSASLASSYQHVSSSQAPKYSSRVPQSQQQYISQTPADTWFQPFIQAANLVKDVTFQPPLFQHTPLLDPEPKRNDKHGNVTIGSQFSMSPAMQNLELPSGLKKSGTPELGQQPLFDELMGQQRRSPGPNVEAQHQAAMNRDEHMRREAERDARERGMHESHARDAHYRKSIMRRRSAMPLFRGPRGRERKSKKQPHDSKPREKTRSPKLQSADSYKASNPEKLSQNLRSRQQEAQRQYAMRLQQQQQLGNLAGNNTIVDTSPTMANNKRRRPVSDSSFHRFDDQSSTMTNKQMINSAHNFSPKTLKYTISEDCTRNNLKRHKAKFGALGQHNSQQVQQPKHTYNDPSPSDDVRGVAEDLLVFDKGDGSQSAHPFGGLNRLTEPYRPRDPRDAHDFDPRHSDRYTIRELFQRTEYLCEQLSNPPLRANGPPMHEDIRFQLQDRGY